MRGLCGCAILVGQCATCNLTFGCVPPRAGPARFEQGDRLGRDHVAVGHKAYPPDAEALAQPVDGLDLPFWNQRQQQISVASRPGVKCGLAAENVRGAVAGVVVDPRARSA